MQWIPLSFLAVKIGVFYVVYYAFLSAYFVAMMLIFYQTLDDNEPKWKGPEKGIIGMNPGWYDCEDFH